MTARGAASASGGGAPSTSTRDELVTSRTPAPTIAPATTSAVIESSASTPVMTTSVRPTSTPTDVQASGRRWAASPASAGESVAAASRYRYLETAKLVSADT